MVKIFYFFMNVQCVIWTILRASLMLDAQPYSCYNTTKPTRERRHNLDWQIALSVGSSVGASEDALQVQNPKLFHLRPLFKLWLKSSIRSCSSNYDITVHLFSRKTPEMLIPLLQGPMKTDFWKLHVKSYFHELSKWKVISLIWMTNVIESPMTGAAIVW